MLNILVISQYFWPENFRINDLTEGLIERGHHVTVLTGMPNYPEGKIFSGYGLFRNRSQIYKGVRICRVPLVPRGKGGGVRLALNYLSFALFSCVMAPFLCREKYDVIFVFEPSPITVGLPALVMKSLKKAPVLLWVQDLWPESLSAAGAINNPQIIKGIHRFVRFIYRGCDRILVTSKAYFPSVIANGGKSSALRYFPQSVESLYKPVILSDNTPEHEMLPNGFRVMFAGNIGAAQSFSTILDTAEMLKQISDIKFIIVGDGRLWQWVEDEVNTRNLKKTVHLIGRHPLEMMPRFFSLADALLVTLKKDPVFSLTIPGKVQSYLACGKPVIAALDGEGSRIISEAKAGVVCAAEDAKGLAGAVLEMYEMTKDQRDAMGEAGLIYHNSHFDREKLISQLEGWMKECVDEVHC